MAIEFKLPDLGENIESGDVINVLVAVGDTVTEDQPLVELETDKAVIEVPCPANGTIESIHVKAGDTVSVGQTLLTLATATDAPAAAQPEADQPAAAESTDQPPAAAASDSTPSDAVEAGPAAETAPAAPASASTAAHTVSAAEPEPGPAQPSTPEPETGRTTYPADATGPRPIVPAAPSVRRLAREIGIDIAQVSGSGPGGRISEADVKAHARQLHAGSGQPAGSGAPDMPAASIELPDFSQWGEVERKPISKVRRLTANRLQGAWHSPLVTQFDKADITDLERWRKELGPRVEHAGGKLTPTAILIKVLGAALKVFPQFNTSFDAGRGEIIQKHYVNIGVAVDTPHGLLVPVLRDVDRKNITELAIELVGIAAKTQDRKVTPEEMQGGSMTISNVGAIGGTGFTPIINPPEVAILGVARSNWEPVYIDGAFQPRFMLPLMLTYDHRVIDGADGARFLHWIADALANPLILALEG